MLGRQDRHQTATGEGLANLSMSKKIYVTCNDCYFRTAGLCALPGNEVCPTFRLHKTGSLEKVRNDAAVIWAERPVIATGFVSGVPDIRPARSLLGLLGWLAFGAAGGTAEGLPPEWPEGR